MKLRLCGAVAAVAIIILSCGAPGLMKRQDIKPEIKAIPDKAVLVIIRGTRFNSGTEVPNYLDGKFIGFTIGKSYFITQVEPGIHYIVSQAENRGCARLNFEAGKIYYLLQVLYPGVKDALSYVFIGSFTPKAEGRTDFDPKNPEDAMKDINECSFYIYEPLNGTMEMKPEEFKETTEDFDKEAKKDPEKYKKFLEYKGY